MPTWIRRSKLYRPYVISMTFSPFARVFCSNRLIGQSAVQSRMMLVGLQSNHGLSFGDRLLKPSAAFWPTAVYTTFGRGGCVACTCCNVILPAANCRRQALRNHGAVAAARGNGEHELLHGPIATDVRLAIGEAQRAFRGIERLRLELIVAIHRWAHRRA